MAWVETKQVYSTCHSLWKQDHCLCAVSGGSLQLALRDFQWWSLHNLPTQIFPCFFFSGSFPVSSLTLPCCHLSSSFIVLQTVNFRCPKFLLFFTAAFTYWRSSPDPSEMVRRSCWPNSAHDTPPCVGYMAVHSPSGFPLLISHWLAVLASNKNVFWVFFPESLSGLIRSCWIPSQSSGVTAGPPWCLTVAHWVSTVPAPSPMSFVRKLNHPLGETDTCDSAHPPALGAQPPWGLSQGALHRNFTQMKVSFLAIGRLHRRKRGCVRLSSSTVAVKDIFTKQLSYLQKEK